MTSTRELNELARACVETAVEDKVLEEVVQQLKDVCEAFSKEPGILADLHQPVTPRDKRQTALRKGLEHECHPILIHTLLLLQEANLLDEISLFTQTVVQAAHERADYIDLQVTSAAPLTKSEKSDIEERFRKKNRTLHIEHIVEPALIGGFILEYHGMRVDASIAGMSKRLQHALHLS